MSTIQVIVKDGQDHISVVESGAGRAGKTLMIKAKSGVQYELKDLATQHAPEQVLITRKGKDLLIKFAVDGEFDKDAPADVVLENYYDAQDSSLVGLAEDGQSYSYVPQEGDASFSTSNLSDGASSFQSLGYAAPAEASNNAAYALAALALLGAGVAAASGGGSHHHPVTATADTTPPTATSAITTITDDTGTANDFLTKDQTLVISGTNTPVGAGEVVQISLDGGKTWANTTATTPTAWTYDNTANPLSSGAHTVLTRVVDAAGNGGTVASTVITIDTTVPASTSAILAITTDTGVSNSDFVTSDTTLSVGGSNSALAAGEIVQISLDGGATWSNTTATSATTWTFDNQGNALASGAHVFQTRVIDAAANAGSVASKTITIDTSGSVVQPGGGTDPISSATVVVSGITDDTGVSGTDYITADQALILKGTTTGAPDGTNVDVLVDGVHVGYTTVTGNAINYDYTTTTLAVGNHTVQFNLVDLAGNAAATGNVQTITIDNSGSVVQPGGGTDPISSATVVVSGITDDTGVSGTDYITADQALILKGTTTGAPDGTNVDVLVDGVHVGYTTVTGNAINYDYTTTTLAVGNHTVQFNLVDLAGNAAATGNVQTITIDNSGSVVQPGGGTDPISSATVVVSGITDDTGVSGTDYITADQALILKGTTTGAPDGTNVDVLVDGVHVGYTTVTGNAINYDYTTTTLAVGNHTVQFNLVDLAGNAAATGNVQTITIDNSGSVVQPGGGTDPISSATVVVSGITDDTGVSGTDYITADQALILKGTTTGAPDGTNVDVLVDGVHVGYTTVTGNAINYDYTTTTLAVGNHTVQFNLVDLAGNAAATGNVQTITIDNSGSVVQPGGGTDPISSATVVVSGITDDTGVSGTDYITADQALILKGTTTGAPDGTNVDVLVDGVHVGYTTVTGNAINYDYTTTTLAVGNHTVQFNLVDLAGNAAATGNVQTITIDNSGSVVQPGGGTDPISSATVVVSGITDDTGVSGTDYITADQALILKGTTTGAPDGTNVDVLVDGVHVGYTTVTGNAINYDYTTTTLAVGNHTVQFNLVDLAGNAAATGNVQTITIDNSGSVVQPGGGTDPISSATVVVSGITDDTGVSGTDYITADQALILKGTTTGAPDGTNVDVLVDGVHVGYTTVTGNAINYDYTTTTLAVGNHTVQFNLVDLAGNAAATGNVQTITIDNSGTVVQPGGGTDPISSATVVVSGITDDTGVSGTDYITADQALILKGTTTGAPDGTNVDVLVDGVHVGYTTVTGNAINYDYTTTTLAVGNHTVQFNLVDLAGNAAATGNVQTITIDNSGSVVQPGGGTDPISSATVVVSGITDDTGVSGTDYITADQALILKGTTTGAPDGTNVDVLVDGVHVGYTTVTGNAINYDYTTTTLAVGNHTVQFNLVDLAGNAAATGNVQTITIDNSGSVVQPGGGTDPISSATVVVSGITDDTGVSGTDYITADQALILKGTTTGAPDGTNVDVLVDGVHVGYTTVTGNAINYDYTTTTLAVGNHTVQFNLVDLAGNAAATGNVQTITIDNSGSVVQPGGGTDPISSATVVVSGITDDTGVSGTDYITADQALILKGTTTGAPDGTNVDVLVDGVHVGYTTVTGNAINYDYTTTTLAVGNHTVQFNLVDLAGNAAATGNVQTITIDNSGSVVQPGGGTDPISSATVVVSGITDDTGVSGTDYITADQALILKGTTTGAPDGTNVDVLVDGVHVGYTTVTGNAINYDYTTTTLAVGNHTVQFNLVDLAGNAAATGNVQTITIDNSGSVVQPGGGTDPISSATVVVSGITDDTGVSGTDYITADQALILKGTTTGAPDGTNVDVLVDGVHVGYTTVTGNAINYDYTTTTLAVGNHTVQFNLVDLAGNAAATGNVQTITIDNSGSVVQPGGGTDPISSATVVVSGITDDTGVSGTDYITADQALILKGTTTGAPDGTNVDVLVDGVHVGYTTVTGNAINYDYTTTTLAVGNHTVQFNLVDLAGNAAATGNVQTITIDNGSPTTVSAIVSYVDDQGIIQSATSTAATTDDPNITLKGTVGTLVAATGEVLNVYKDGLLMGAATVTAGNWTYDVALTDTASHAYTVKVVNSAGGANPGTGSLAIAYDNIQPNTTSSIVSYVDDIGIIQNTASTAATTDDGSITLTGTLGSALAAGETVRVYKDGVLMTTGTITTTSTSWTLSGVDITADQSSHTYTVGVADAAGNVKPGTGSLAIAYDNIQPNTTSSIVSYVDDIGIIQNTASTAATTDDGSITLTGTLGSALAAGETVRVYKDGVLMTTGTITTTSTSWTLSGVDITADQSSHTYTVGVADAAGNVKPGTGSLAIAYDNIQPNTTSSIVSYVDDIGIIQNTASTAATTDDGSITLTGTLGSALAAGETVRVYKDGVLMTTGTITTTSTSWTLSGVDITADQSSHTYTVGVADAAGNVKPGTGSLAIAYDNIQPNTTSSIVSYVDDIGIIQNTASTAATTDDGSITLTGTLGSALAAGETVRVYKDGVLMTTGTITTTSTSWTLSGVDITADQSSHTYTVGVADAAGNVKPGTGSLAIAYDNIQPNTTSSIVSYVDDIGIIQNTASTAATTDDGSITLTGTLGSALAAGETVRVYKDGVLMTTGTITTTSTSWTLSGVDITADQSSHTYTVGVADAAGNVKPGTGSLAIAYDNIQPNTTSSIVSYVDDIGIIQNTASTAATTDDGSITLTGTLGSALAAGETVRVYKDGVLMTTGTITTTSTSWTLSGVDITADQSSHTYTVGVADAAGNVKPGTGSLAIAYDNIQPNTTSSIVSYVDDIGIIQNTASTAATTDDGSITLTGTLGSALAAGETVRVYKDGVLMTTGTITTTSTSWTLSGVDITADQSSHTYTVGVADAAGNVKPGTGSLAIAYDNIQPNTTSSIVSYVDDIGIIQNTASTAATTDDGSITLTGTLGSALAAGETVRVYKDGVLMTTGTITTTSTSWTLSGVDITADQTSHTYTVGVADAAGNVKPGTGSLAIAYDNIQPNTTSSIVSYVDDIGIIQNTASTAATTDDGSITLTGTLGSALAAGETVRVYKDGVLMTTGTITTTSTSWTLSGVDITADQSSHTYTVGVADAAGNVKPGTGSLAIAYDNIQPNTTSSIVSYVDDIGIIQNTASTAATTDDGSITLTGTLGSALAAGETVRVYKDGVLMTTGTITTTSTSWTLSGVDITADQTSHTYTVGVADAAGNVKPGTGSLAIAYDNIQPNTTSSIVSYVDDIGIIQNTASTAATTDDGSITLTGTLGSALAAGETVRVYKDGVLMTTGTITTTSTSWTLSGVDITADQTSHTYTVGVADAAGNVKPGTGSLAIAYDNIQPNTVSTINTYKDDVGVIQSATSTAATTDDPTIVLNGTVGALGLGETVKIFKDGVAQTGTATVDGAGNWTYSIAINGDTTSHNYTSAVMDAAGNIKPSTGSLAVAFDNTPPAVGVTIANYVDNVGAAQGTITTSGTTTDDRTPVLNGAFTGTLAATDVIRIYDGSTFIGNATLIGSNWTYALPNLADGSTHTYHAVAADAVGNENTAGQSSNFVINVDLTVIVNALNTLDTTPIVTGSIGFALEAGEYLLVTINGIQYRSDSTTATVTIDPANNTWYVEVPTALPIGTYDVSAVLKDASNAPITTDDTTNELVIAATPVVTVGAAGVDANQKATAYTIGEDGMWRIHSNQAMLDANGTSSSTLGSFSTTTLVSNSGGGYMPNNYVQNATFMDFNRDGHMDLFTEDSNYDDGQQTFVFNGSTYTALQVGAPAAVGGDMGTAGSAQTFSWYGGVVAIDKTGDGYVDLAYGDQTPTDAEAGGGFDSQFVLNIDGTIIGMVKDGAYTEGQYGNQGTVSSNYGNSDYDMELSGVDLNNDGKVDVIYHATAGYTKLGGASATSPTSYNQNRLVVATNNGDGSWQNSQIIDNVFQRMDDDPGVGNGVAMTWADFNGDGFMDLFLARGNENTTTQSGAVGNAQEYASRIYFNDGLGHLQSTAVTGIGNATGVYTFTDTLMGGASISVDWNGDGKVDVIEMPTVNGAGGGTTLAGQTGPVNLYTNNTSGGTVAFATTALVSSIGSSTNAVTGGLAADIDWDGDRDLLVFTQQGTTKYVTNTNTVAVGTALHFRILDANGINAFYGNTVQLYNSAGVLVGTQMLNPQSGSQTSDSSALVDFYGLSATETYSLVILKNNGAASADVGGTALLGANVIENVNAAWTGLTTGAANHAYVLTAESGANIANTTGTVGIVGTGYNDTFYASLGSDIYNGGGGTETISGVTAWNNTGGQDILDFKLAGSTAITVNLNLTTAQNTGWDSVTLKNIEGVAGGSGADTFTGSAANNYFEGRGGNDSISLANGGQDTVAFKIVTALDATGGNGNDTISNFFVGTYEGTAGADRINLHDLLIGYTADANGAAHYINAVATMDAGETIGNYLTVTQSGGNTLISIDRDGAGSAYSSALVATLTGVSTDLVTLMANHQIVV